MSTTEDKNTIDEKKGNIGGKNLPDFKEFINKYISSIIVTIGFSIFIVGGLGLYTAKVAQANILPDNIELEPYTNIARVVEEMPIDINIIRQTVLAENKDILSQKVIFNSKEYLDSFNSSFFCAIKKYATPGGLFSNGPLFISKSYESIMALNFYAINSVFFYLNYLPESLIMILFGMFGVFIATGLYFFNLAITIISYIVNIQDLFRGESENKPGFWEENKNISFFSIKKILLFFFWAYAIVMSLFIIPMITTLHAIISPLYATYKIQSTNEEKNVLNFITDNFGYKKLLFFILCTTSLVSNGIKYLGNFYLFGIIVAILFAYFMGLYSLYIPEVNENGFTTNIVNKIRQASVMKEMIVKTDNLCPQIPILQEEKVQSGGVQTGGGKNKKTHSTKKYNIRLV